MSYMIGVDVGGTFTDFSVFNQETGELFNYKDSSTPADPSRAIVKGVEDVLAIKQASPEEVSYLAHGTTVGTNALIEKKGCRLGLITTKGFKDLMEIGTQRRPSLYNLQTQKPYPLVPSGLNCTVTERIRYDGTVETPLDEEETRQVVRYLKAQGVAAIAVCTLFSFINPVHELRIEEIIHEEFPEAYVTVSSKLAPEFREFSRMSTTVMNSYLGPVMERYVNNFRDSIAGLGIQVEPYVTQSNGSIISIKETIDCPIKTALSGPSAGVIAAAYIGKQCGSDKIITFDMGGTSADISLIENYTPQVSNERYVEGYPARIPMINIITIGAGGGSIAKIDDGGALKVGPKSAGATPGPACYMRGGEDPCVTDANIVLGKLNQKKILGGRMDVDIELAKKAIREKICDKSDLDLNRAANGIITVVNSNMVRAIRSVSVEKGYDVREFSLMAFGGAGPLHACEVAKELGMYIVGGSVPELCDGKLYNTSYVFGRSGELLAKHRKIHLFDIDVPGGQRFMESDTFAPGNSITTFETEFGTMGLCVCFDMRFEELARCMALRGAKVIFVPAAFNMTTGPAHWEILFRQRAVDNQCFTVGVAPARNEAASYVSYGNSIAVDPWGSVLCRAGAEETTLYADLDLSRVDAVRQQLPIWKSRRTDLYEVSEK